MRGLTHRCRVLLISCRGHEFLQMRPVGHTPRAFRRGLDDTLSLSPRSTRRHWIIPRHVGRQKYERHSGRRISTMPAQSMQRSYPKVTQPPPHPTALGTEKSNAALRVLAPKSQNKLDDSTNREAQRIRTLVELVRLLTHPRTTPHRTRQADIPKLLKIFTSSGNTSHPTSGYPPGDPLQQSTPRLSRRTAWTKFMATCINIR